MATRYRSRGSSETNAISCVGGTKTQARYNFASKAFEFRTLPSITSVTGNRSDLETMMDDLGCKNAFNGCLHTRRISHYICGRRCHGQVVPWKLTYSWYDVGFDGGYIAGEVFPQPYLAGTPSEPAMDPIDWSSLVSDVGSNLSGRMESGMNLLATLGEVGQTVEMIKNPYGLLKGGWRRVVKRLTPRQLSKVGANVWLETRYGWMNFFRDCLAFASTAQKVQQHIDYLTQTSGRYVSLSKSKVDVVEPKSTIWSVGTAPNTWRWILDKFTRRATFSLDVKRERALSVYTRNDFIIQYQGRDRLLEALWDLIPFSFCVDWFINIGDFVKSSPMYWNQSNLRQMGYSVKREWSASYHVGSGFTLNGQTFSDEFESGSSTVFKTYERSPGFPPESSTVGFFGGLNLIHLADGCALVAQRL